MKLLLLNSTVAFVLSQTLLGMIIFVVFIVLLEIWRNCQLVKRLKKDEKNENDKKADFVFSSEHLTPMEWREKLLSNIDDGRLYQITSPHGFAIACAKEYNAQEGRLSCYAYVSIRDTASANLHICDPCSNSHSREFIGKTPLDICYEQDLGIIMSEDVMISPFITDGDCNCFKFYMLKAGLQWDIEQGEQRRFFCHAYRLKTK